MAMGLRLARFNSMIDVEKPKWQSNYFTGMPAPAGAITVLLPLYLDGLGIFDARGWPWLIAVYMLAMALLLVSTIPTFSGKLLGERISGDYVLPIFVGVVATVALLLTYPYGTLTLVTLLYLAAIPLSYRRFESKLYEPAEQTPGTELVKLHEEENISQAPTGETKHWRHRTRLFGLSGAGCRHRRHARCRPRPGRCRAAPRPAPAASYPDCARCAIGQARGRPTGRHEPAGARCRAWRPACPAPRPNAQRTAAALTRHASRRD